MRWLLENHGHHAAVFFADKKYSAAGIFFEYTFEPVLRPLKPLFYAIGLPRFVSNYLFAAWEDGERVDGELLEDGQNLIRYKRPEDLKRLLHEPLHLPDGEDPLTAIAAFCAAYRRQILHEIALMDADEVATTWSMDLSDTALLMILQHWGQFGDELEVHCDESKPLQASAARISELATTDQADAFSTSELPPAVRRDSPDRSRSRRARELWSGFSSLTSSPARQGTCCSSPRSRRVSSGESCSLARWCRDASSPIATSSTSPVGKQSSTWWCSGSWAIGRDGDETRSATCVR